MSLRQFAISLSAAGGLVLALAAPAAAQSMPSAMPAAPSLPSAPGVPAAPALPGAPDMRPMWHGGASPSSVVLPDARTRDAWLNECHRRTTMYYDGHRKNRRSRDHVRTDSAYSYCEAYFDDYYRTAGQHAYAYPVMAYAARPMMMAPAQTAQTVSEPVEEIVTTTYEPVRSRVIPAPRRVAPARRVPDKRIRVY